MNEQLSQLLISELKKWETMFPGIILSYAYDKGTNFHIVEVAPETIRRGNEEYKKAELNFWMKCFSEFPCDNILISEPSEISDMSNILYTNKH